MSTRTRIKLAHSINNLLFNRFRFLGSRKIGRFISNLLLPELEKPIRVPTIYKFDLYVNANGGNEIYRLGFYEAGTLDVIKKCLVNGDNFIDVGASIGLMSVFAGRLTPKGTVLSFEPQKERFGFLEKNLQINNCTNARAFNNGLGEKEDELKLYVDLSSPSLVDREKSKGAFEMVDVLVLDNVVALLKIEKIKFIKIDVEGFEINVLKGAKNILQGADAPILCIEYVERFQRLNSSDTSIFDFVSQINGYKIFQLEKSSNTVSRLILVESCDKLRDNDNIYCFLPHHINSLRSKGLFKSII